MTFIEAITAEPTVVGVTSTTDVEPTEVSTEVALVSLCDCGNPITRKPGRGRPPKSCVQCRETRKEEIAEARITKCVGTKGKIKDGKGCGHQLKKPSGRGRPSVRCESCKAKIANSKVKPAPEAEVVSA